MGGTAWPRHPVSLPHYLRASASHTRTLAKGSMGAPTASPAATAEPSSRAGACGPAHGRGLMLGSLPDGGTSASQGMPTVTREVTPVPLSSRAPCPWWLLGGMMPTPPRARVPGSWNMQHPPAADPTHCPRSCSGCLAQPVCPPSGPRAPFPVAMGVSAPRAWERPPGTPALLAGGCTLRKTTGRGSCSTTLDCREARAGERQGHGEVWVGARGQDTGGFGPSPLHVAQCGQGSSLRVSGQPGGQLWGAVPWVSLATTLSPGDLGRQAGKGKPHRDHKTGYSGPHSGQCWAPPHSTLRGLCPKGACRGLPWGPAHAGHF